jgi:hypothetical protein
MKLIKSMVRWGEGEKGREGEDAEKRGRKFAQAGSLPACRQLPPYPRRDTSSRAASLAAGGLAGGPKGGNREERRARLGTEARKCFPSIVAPARENSL